MSVPGPLAISIASAMQQQEGYGTPNAVTITANNNPLALRSWPGYGTRNGFAVFPDYATGFSKGMIDVQTNIDAGLSLAQFISKFEGGPANVDRNNIPAYTAFVASQVGIDPNVPMSAAASGARYYDPSMQPYATLADSEVGTDSALQAGAIDWGTIGLVGLGALLIWWVADEFF